MAMFQETKDDSALWLQEKIEGLVTVAEELRHSASVFGSCYTAEAAKLYEFDCFRSEICDLVKRFADELSKSDSIAAKLKKLLDHYRSLDFEDWQDSVQQVVEDALEIQRACETTGEVYARLMHDLREKQDIGETVVSQLQWRAENEKHAFITWWEAGASLFVVALFGKDILCLYFFSMILSSHPDDPRHAPVARRIRAAEDAANFVAKDVIPAIKSMIGVVEQLGTFFDGFHQQVCSFVERSNATATLQEKKNKHFSMFNSKVLKLQSICDAFLDSASLMKSSLEDILRAHERLDESSVPAKPTCLEDFI